MIDVGGEPPELAPRKNHTIEAVVDRIVIREGIDDRLAESINLAISHGEGAVLVSYFVRDPDQPEAGVWHDRLFSTLYACPNCKISFEELEPRTFSFNSPYGACPTCEGLGSRESSIRNSCWATNTARWPMAYRAVEECAGRGGETASQANQPIFLRSIICSGIRRSRSGNPPRASNFCNGNDKNFLGV